MKIQSRQYVLLLLFSVIVGSLYSEARAEDFEIVTDENCSVNAEQVHYHCRFPNIIVKELRGYFLPIPFESVVRVRPSRACGLNAVDSALRIRLAKSGPRASNFLRYEDFAMDHFRQRILSDPRSYPLGNVSIYPLVDDIFHNLRFSRDCRITFEVELNQTNLRSKRRVDEHIATLTQRLQTLQRAHIALVELRQEQNRRMPLLGVVARLQQFFQGNQRVATLQALRLQWNVLLAPLKKSVEALHHEGYQVAELEDISEQLTDFTATLNQAIAEGEAPPEGVAELLERVQAQPAEIHDARPTFVLDEAHLAQMAQELRNFEAEIALVRAHFMGLFPEGRDNPFLEQDFEHAFEELVEGPHGLIDEFYFRLGRIGQTQ